MTVQLVLLKSGEELIADVREIVDKETEKQISLVFINPYRVSVDIEEVLVLNEQTAEQPKATINFDKWMPLSKATNFYIPYDWVVTITEPHDDILNSYLQKFGGENDSQSDSIENASDTDLGD